MDLMGYCRYLRIQNKIITLRSLCGVKESKVKFQFVL